VTIPCRSQELLPFLSVVYFFLPLLYINFFHSPSLHFAIYFLVYLLVLLITNLYTTLFWEFYFLPFSVHVQTNIIHIALLSLLWRFIKELHTFLY
jgi:hypothetical protein